MNKSKERKWTHMAVVCLLGAVCGFSSCDEDLDPWVPVTLEAECQQKERIPYDGGTFTVSVNSNTDWTITTPDWLTADRTSGTGQGTVNITAAKNTDADRRSGYVKIIAGGSEPDGNIAGRTSKSFSVTQANIVDVVEITNVSSSLTRKANSSAGDGYINYYGSVTYTVNTTLTDQEINSHFTNARLNIYLYERLEFEMSGTETIENIPLTNGTHTIEVDFDTYRDVFWTYDVWIIADYNGKIANLFSSNLFQINK